MHHTMEEEDQHLSPLLTAAKMGEVATFKSLLQDGSSDVLEADKNNRTVLHWATQAESISTILAGLSYGLSWHVNTKSKREFLTPLHEACLIGHTRITHLLLALGSDVTAKTKEGYTPLLCAAGNGHVEVTKVLIGAGCDGNEIISPIGINALHIASWTGQANVVKTLLEMGVEVETQSKMQKTAIEFAIEQGHTEVMEEIRNHRKKLDKGIHDKSFFQKKIMQVGDKIRGYYEETLKQEVEYFEEQMEEQSLQQEKKIAFLEKDIERLKLGKGPSKARLQRKGATLIGLPNTKVVNGKTHNQRKLVFPSLAKFAPMDKITESDKESDFESDFEDHPETRSSSSDGSASSPPINNTTVIRRKSHPRVVRQRSMVDLVSEMAQKENSMTNLRKPEVSEDSAVQSSLKTSQRDWPMMEAAKSTSRHVTFSPTTMQESPATPKSLQKPKLLSPSDPPRTRRKSFAEFFRPSPSPAEKEDKQSVRRKSVASRMQSQPAAPDKPKSNRNSFSILHFPLPGIPTKLISQDEHQQARSSTPP